MQLINAPIISFLFVSILWIGGEKYSIDDRQINPVDHCEVSNDALFLNRDEGVIYYLKTPFTGVGVSKNANGKVAEKIHYQSGKRNGYKRKWFKDGQLSFEAIYVDNKLHGKVFSWWSNGNLRSESNFKEGKADGKQLQYYSGGEIFKALNMANGKEEGLQQAWRKNGKIYVNYEAKNGRIFGLKRASLCFELGNENIIVNE